MNWRRTARRRAPGRLRVPASRARAALGQKWLSSRLLRQGVTSAVAFLLILLLAGLPLGPSEDFRRLIRDVLVSDFDFSRLAQKVGRNWELADFYPEFIRARFPGHGAHDDAMPALGEDDLGSLTLPVEGQVVSWFGWRKLSGGGEEFHPGLNFIAPEGAPVMAAAEGVVVSIYSEEGAQGHALEIRHGQRWSTLYVGLAQVLVADGAEVQKGQVIGTLGSEEGPHLHFELHAAGNAVDPAPRLGLRGER